LGGRSVCGRAAHLGGIHPLHSASA
jgi:hypothetical protein